MPVSRVPERGDFIWVEFTHQAGREQAGRRPAIVLSPRAYNAASGLALLCPVTSQVKGYPFEVAIPAGSLVKGVVLADQGKSVDWRSRNTKFIAQASKDVISEVQAKVRVLVE